MNAGFFEIHSGLPREGPGDEALAVVDQEAIEIDLFRKYPAFYRYVFYIMRRGY